MTASWRSEFSENHVSVRSACHTISVMRIPFPHFQRPLVSAAGDNITRPFSHCPSFLAFTSLTRWDTFVGRAIKIQHCSALQCSCLYPHCLVVLLRWTYWRPQLEMTQQFRCSSSDWQTTKVFPFTKINWTKCTRRIRGTAWPHLPSNDQRQ